MTISKSKELYELCCKYVNTNERPSYVFMYHIADAVFDEIKNFIYDLYDAHFEYLDATKSNSYINSFLHSDYNHNAIISYIKIYPVKINEMDYLLISFKDETSHKEVINYGIQFNKLFSCKNNFVLFNDIPDDLKDMINNYLSKCKIDIKKSGE